MGPSGELLLLKLLFLALPLFEARKIHLEKFDFVTLETGQVDFRETIKNTFINLKCAVMARNRDLPVFHYDKATKECKLGLINRQVPCISDQGPDSGKEGSIGVYIRRSVREKVKCTPAKKEKPEDLDDGLEKLIQGE